MRVWNPLLKVLLSRKETSGSPTGTCAGSSSQLLFEAAESEISLTCMTVSGRLAIRMRYEAPDLNESASREAPPMSLNTSDELLATTLWFDRTHINGLPFLSAKSMCPFQ
jgi:hypothetical protein